MDTSTSARMTSEMKQNSGRKSRSQSRRKLKGRMPKRSGRKSY